MSLRVLGTSTTTTPRPGVGVIGAWMAGLLVAACWGSAWAQDTDQAPHPDASFDLPRPMLGTQITTDGGSALPPTTSNEQTPSTPDEASNVRFGLLCLTLEATCTDPIVVIDDANGWWVEDAALEILGGGEDLASKSMEQSIWRLIPANQAQWDDDTQTLLWGRPLDERIEQDLSRPRSEPETGAWVKSIPAAMLHYSATVDDTGSATVGGQAVISKGRTSLFAGGVHAQGRFIRDLWRVEHDDAKRRLRYVIGEQIMRPADPLGGAQRVRGIAIERAYDIDPTMATAARPGLHGIIEQPGIVDIYSNGRLISSTPIQPGPYQWGNTPLGSGSQQIELVFRGADGTRSVLSSSVFYGSARMLAKGLTDFSIRAGMPYDTGKHNDLAWQGWVRHGVSSNITMGARGEGQGDHRNAGADASVSFGVGSLDVAGAGDNQGQTAWSASVSVVHKGFDAQMGRTHLAPDYWFLGRDEQVLLGTTRVVDERFVSVGYSTGAFSLRSTLADRVAVDGSRSRSAGVMGTWRSADGWNWFAGVDRVEQSTTRQYQASLGVSIALGPQRNQSLEVRALETERGRGGQVAWNRYSQSVYGWSANASLIDLPTGERGVLGNYQRTTAVGNLVVSGSKTNAQTFARATWSGTLIRANDNWFASSPDQGPRVLVVSSEPGARVLRDNHAMGHVGEQGLMVGGVAPYSHVDIQVDPASLSLQADTSHLKRVLITPRAGVAQVSFDTTANNQVEGVLLISGKPARLGVLTLEDGRVGWVGESGRLWLQGGGAGSWKGVWSDGSTQLACRVVIDGIPLAIVQATCE